MTDSIVFIDTETTGLDPERHEVWEIALIRGDTGEEITWRVKPSLETADPGALRLTRYHERVHEKGWEWGNRFHAAERIALLTSGKHLVGAVPSFDEAFLARFLRNYGQAPAWHYHLVDVETLVAGRLGLEPPWDSEELSEDMGIDPKRFDRHTALGDAQWAKALYEAVMARASDG